MNIALTTKQIKALFKQIEYFYPDRDFVFTVQTSPQLSYHILLSNSKSAGIIRTNYIVGRLYYESILTGSYITFAIEENGKVFYNGVAIE